MSTQVQIMKTKVDQVREIASEKLGEIADLFKEGAKVTLVVRTPGKDDADFILTNDDPAECIRAIRRTCGSKATGEK